MPDKKDELVEQHGSEKNNDKPIGVDDKGNPVVPPDIDKRGSGSGEAGEVKQDQSSNNETIGVP